MVGTSLKGQALLNNAYYNKGTAFSTAERKALKLHGLVPKSVQSLEQQLERAYAQYSTCRDDLAKNVFMNSMADQNVVLYYALLMGHIEEMFPVIYTPTEGEAIQRYSQIFRRPYGCFLDIEDQDDMEGALTRAAEGKQVRYIVVSDGEAILGIGDQGVGGILISVAKLILATACGGVSPSVTLPVVLDAGTENEENLASPLYLGNRFRRVRGQKYHDFVDEFVRSAHRVFPDCYIHFEDFGVTNARKILDRFRGRIPCFNDDIQGTGCVVLAGILSGLHISGVPLSDARFLIYGAGSAGCGIAQQIANGIAVECRCDVAEAYRQITCIDKVGVLTADDDLSVSQQCFTRPSSEWRGKDKTDLAATVSQVKPHVLIGTSTQPGAFTEAVVKEMAKHVDRPIIMPLSNPTRLHEAKPVDLFSWTEGKALVATGSPFAPVEYEGTVFEIGECNNSCCFPGISLGTILSKAERLTDEMIMAAVKAMGSLAPALKDPTMPLVPGVGDARLVSVAIASAVILEAKKLGISREKGLPEDDADMDDWVKKQMWWPTYEDQDHQVDEK